MQFGPFIVPRWKNSEPHCSVAVLLFRDFSNHGLANTIEPLRAANTLSGKTLYSWRYLSLDGGPVTSASGLTIQADGPLADHPGADFLFVVTSYDFMAHVTAANARSLRAARSRFGAIVGMDTGTWLLAHAGLLTGRRVTIHRDEQTNLAERFPDITVLDKRVVHDGDVLSCGGATTAFDLALDLVEQQHGAMLRLELAALFLTGDIRPPKPARPGQVPEAGMAIMRRKIETPVPVSEIARELGMSRKAFEKRCIGRYGIGPGRLYLATRLREAKRMVEQFDISVAEVATRCGYKDASAMTRAFRKEFGVTPRGLRMLRDNRGNVDAEPKS